MSLTDLMSGMKLSSWPTMALVVFMTVFVAILWRTFRKSARAEMSQAAQLPLDDAPVASDKAAHTQ